MPNFNVIVHTRKDALDQKPILYATFCVSKTNEKPALINAYNQDGHRPLDKQYSQHVDLDVALCLNITRSKQQYEMDEKNSEIHIFPIAKKHIEELKSQTVKQFIECFLNKQDDYVETRANHNISSTKYSQILDVVYVDAQLFMMLGGNSNYFWDSGLPITNAAYAKSAKSSESKIAETHLSQSAPVSRAPSSEVPAAYVSNANRLWSVPVSDNQVGLSYPPRLNTITEA